MINSTRIQIKFIYKGELQIRGVDRMHISYVEIKDFYRIPGKKLNYDIYKKDGVWCNVLKTGLSKELLELVGRAIEEVEKVTD